MKYDFVMIMRYKLMKPVLAWVLNNEYNNHVKVDFISTTRSEDFESLYFP